MARGVASHVDVGAPAEVRHRDDRGHDPLAVAEPSYSASARWSRSPAEAANGWTGSSCRTSSSTPARGHTVHHGHVPSAIDELYEVAAGSPDVDDAELSARGREHRCKSSSSVARSCARRHASSAASRSTRRPTGRSLPPARHGGAPVRARRKPRAPSRRRRAPRRGSARGSRAPPRGPPAGTVAGGRAAERHVQVQTGIAERLRQRGELGRFLETVAGAAQHGERVVARDQEVEPFLRGRGLRQRHPRRRGAPLQRVGGERGCRRLRGRTSRHPRVAGRARVMGEERERPWAPARRRAAGRRSPRISSPASRRERVGRELADLLVRKL